MSRVAADATVFHAIADPTRRAILELLRDGEQSVKALKARVRMTASALSQHLGVLRRAGLVADRREGRLRVYAVRPEPLYEVAEWIAFFDRFWDDRLTGLHEHLDRTHGRTTKPPEIKP